MSNQIHITNETTFQDWMDSQPEYDGVTTEHMTVGGIEYVRVADGVCEWFTTQADWDGIMGALIVAFTGDDPDDGQVYTELCGACSSVDIYADEVARTTGEQYSIETSKLDEIVRLCGHLDAVIDVCINTDWHEGGDHQTWLDESTAAEIADWVSSVAEMNS